MFLNYLQIVNYKNLSSTRFSFTEGVNTVIGENDSGKSNAMTALERLLPKIKKQKFVLESYQKKRMKIF